jgi:hypothetical protein
MVLEISLTHFEPSFVELISSQFWLHFYSLKTPRVDCDKVDLEFPVFGGRLGNSADKTSVPASTVSNREVDCPTVMNAAAPVSRAVTQVLYSACTYVPLRYKAG